MWKANIHARINDGAGIMHTHSPINGKIPNKILTCYIGDKYCARKHLVERTTTTTTTTTQTTLMFFCWLRRFKLFEMVWHCNVKVKLKLCQCRRQQIWRELVESGGGNVWRYLILFLHSEILEHFIFIECLLAANANNSHTANEMPLE